MLYTFFTFSSSSIDTMMAYIQGFISDITPLLLPLMGIGVGLLIVSVLIGVFKR